MNIAIITGASSGMGKEFVKQIASRYRKLDEIWVVARRRERLEELSGEVSASLRIFDLDLCNEKDLLELENALDYDKPNVRLLVNSAGFGFLADFNKGACDTWMSMIDLNCKALTRVCYMAIPYMHTGARIINLSSAAAFVPQPGFNVYAATKAYVLSFSRALKGELQDKNISVTAVCPGPVKTEFFDVADPEKSTAFFKKMVMANPTRVVNKALNDAKMNKEYSVYGVIMNIFMMFTKILPHRLFIKIMRW